MIEVLDSIERWRAEDLFAQTLAARTGAEQFVFYEGPPTANGKPGIHHVFARTVKDLFTRHRSMKGYRVDRKAGWDTHGLPVEIEVEKRLGLSGKQDIERLGVAEFNRLCRESVFTYRADWERLSERIAFWLDYDHPYVTYEPDYIESVWWALATLFEAPSRLWSIGLSATQTLFDAGKIGANVRIANADYSAAVAAYRQTVLTAFQQVEDSLAAVRLLSQQILKQQQAVSSSEEALKLEIARYETGVDPYLNVVTLQTTLLTNQETLASLHVLEMTNSVTLIEALGGGWDLSQLPTPAEVSKKLDKVETTIQK